MDSFTLKSFFPSFLISSFTLLAATTAGCAMTASDVSSQGTASAVTDDTDGGTASGAVPGSVVPDALAKQTVGTYAIQTTVAGIARAPIIGEIRSSSSSFGIAEVKREGAGLVVTERWCHSEINSNSSAKVTIADNVPRSGAAITSPFRVWQDGSTVRFARPKVVAIIGAKLDNPETDELPIAASDPRVFDQDGDGRPGVTAKIDGMMFLKGSVYSVARVITSYEGTISSDSKFHGPLTDHNSEQAVVGASNSLLQRSLSTTVDPSQSFVDLVKIDASSTCDQMMKNVKTLFPSVSRR